MFQQMDTSNEVPAISVDFDECGQINLCARTHTGVQSVGRFNDVASAWAAIDAIDTQDEAV
jgi:hypothetical protein